MEIAQATGKSAQFLRVGLQRGILKSGFAYKNDGSSEYSYYCPDKKDTGCGTPDAEIAKQCLQKYMEHYLKNNPNFFVFNAVIHMDEATPHLHIDYIPIGHYQTGIDTRNAMARALEEMGYTGIDAATKWRANERLVFTEICESHGLTIAPSEESKSIIDKLTAQLSSIKQAFVKVVLAVNMLVCSTKYSRELTGISNVLATGISMFTDSFFKKIGEYDTINKCEIDDGSYST